MSNLQKISLILGIIISSAIIVGAVDTYNKSRFACKETEIKVEEANAAVAATVQYVESLHWQAQTKYIQDQLYRLEDDYRGKSKDQYYIDRKRRLEKDLKDAEANLMKVNSKAK